MSMRRPTGAAFAITDPNGDRFFVDVVKSGRINRPIGPSVSTTLLPMRASEPRRGGLRDGGSQIVDYDQAGAELVDVDYSALTHWRPLKSGCIAKVVLSSLRREPRSGSTRPCQASA
jgi:hypothetical protein